MNKNSRIIISADDFGINATANRNILKLAGLKKIDRVGIIIDGKYSAEEIEVLLQSGIKLDLHLNATEKEFPRLCEDRRLIRRSFRFFSHFISGRAGAGITKLDWERQLKKFSSIFHRLPDGLSSHEHVHFLPAYFKIITSLAKKNRINYVRLGGEGILKYPNGVSQILNFLHKKNLRIFRESGLGSSGYFASLDWMNNFEKNIFHMPSGTVEIACHPQRTDEMKKIMYLKK